MNESHRNTALAVFLIGLAFAGRLIPHPDNFTPVLAVALFGGAVLRGPLAFIVPLGAMFLSDVLLGHRLSWMTLVIYACFTAGTALGRLLARHRTWSRTALATMAGSIVFYVVTNFAVWAASTKLYSHTVEGLLQCYVMALPFFRNALAGDLFWTVTLFVLYDATRASPTPLGEGRGKG